LNASLFNLPWSSLLHLLQLQYLPDPLTLSISLALDCTCYASHASGPFRAKRVPLGNTYVGNLTGFAHRHGETNAVASRSNPEPLEPWITVYIPFSQFHQRHAGQLEHWARSNTVPMQGIQIYQDPGLGRYWLRFTYASSPQAIGTQSTGPSGLGDSSNNNGGGGHGSAGQPGNGFSSAWTAAPGHQSSNALGGYGATSRAPLPKTNINTPGSSRKDGNMPNATSRPLPAAGVARTPNRTNVASASAQDRYGIPSTRLQTGGVQKVPQRRSSWFDRGPGAMPATV